MPRALLLRAADVLTDHPGPMTRHVQRTLALFLIDAAFNGIRYGRKLWPNSQENP